MRRFSQRSALVTLSEINITPLLDLAFVLLIIFVITTPLLEQSINLRLPQGGKPDVKPDPRNVRTVEITAQGGYVMDKKSLGIRQVQDELLKTLRANPNLIVYIRADENGRNKDTYAVIDFCQRNGIKLSLRTEPPKK